MASNESSFITCPCCSSTLDLPDLDTGTSFPVPGDARSNKAEHPVVDVQCPCCDWEFTVDAANAIENDGEIESESELEVNDDGEFIEPDGDGQDNYFPPWHGMASACLEQRGRGLRDTGERSPYILDDFP